MRLQWFERAIDSVGIAATLINVYITKVGRHLYCLLVLRCVTAWLCACTCPRIPRSPPTRLPACTALLGSPLHGRSACLFPLRLLKLKKARAFTMPLRCAHSLLSSSSPQEYVLEMKEDKKDKAELAEGKHN